MLDMHVNRHLDDVDWRARGQLLGGTHMSTCIWYHPAATGGATASNEGFCGPSCTDGGGDSDVDPSLEREGLGMVRG